MVYETKSLTLEQVDELYLKVDHAWQSKGFVPSVHAFRDDGDMSTSLLMEKPKWLKLMKIPFNDSL